MYKCYFTTIDELKMKIKYIYIYIYSDVREKRKKMGDVE